MLLKEGDCDCLPGTKDTAEWNAAITRVVVHFTICASLFHIVPFDRSVLSVADPPDEKLLL